jgi:DNA polymerase (family 10)
MRNAEIATVLYEIADLLELKGENRFKLRAYRNAARSIEELDRDIEDVLDQGELEDIPGVGEAIAKKVEELIRSGRLRYLEELKEEFPAGLIRVMQVQDVGPKTAARLYRELGVKDLRTLKEAVEAHRLLGLKGFGEKTEENILKGIGMLEASKGRSLLGDALPKAEGIRDHLHREGFGNAEIAGSLRRMKETIGDIDVLVGTEDGEAAIEAFLAHPLVADVILRGETKVSVHLQDGVQVDLRVVGPASYGAALQYFTGSKEHNVEMRKLAISKGLKLNEYGLFDGKRSVAGRTEEGIYEALGLPFIPPEMRESRGELSIHQVPDLIERADIKGDLHIHTDLSDGSASLEEFASRCIELGYDYMAVTEHSESLRVARGVDVKGLRDRLDGARPEGIEVLVGAEVEILPDGRLDYDDETLEELDIVVGAVHSRFKMDEKEMTERILAALSNEHLDILAHPTGRLIKRREPYALDLDRVIEAAVDNSVALEINAQPDRLDLNDVNCRKARDAGAMLVISTDAHSLDQLEAMRLGIATARRGWLERKDVLNTLPLKELRRALDL